MNTTMHDPANNSCPRNVDPRNEVCACDDAATASPNPTASFEYCDGCTTRPACVRLGCGHWGESAIAEIMRDVRLLAIDTAEHTGESTGNLAVQKRAIEDKIRALVGLPPMQASLELASVAPAPADWAEKAQECGADVMVRGAIVFEPAAWDRFCRVLGGADA